MKEVSRINHRHWSPGIHSCNLCCQRPRHCEKGLGIPLATCYLAPGGIPPCCLQFPPSEPYREVGSAHDAQRDLGPSSESRVWLKALGPTA